MAVLFITDTKKTLEQEIRIPNLEIADYNDILFEKKKIATGETIIIDKDIPYFCDILSYVLKNSINSNTNVVIYDGSLYLMQIKIKCLHNVEYSGSPTITYISKCPICEQRIGCATTFCYVELTELRQL